MVVLRQSFIWMAVSTQKRSRSESCPGNSPGGLKASGHAAFLDQAEPALDQVVALRPIFSRVLVADGIFPTDRREHLR